MELHFSITPAHTQTRLAEKVAEEMAKEDRLIASVRRWQERAFLVLALPVGLFAAVLAVNFMHDGLILEKLIGIGVVALVSIALWWRFSLRRWRRAQPDTARRPFRGLNQRLVEMRLRPMLAAAEGRYCLAFDDQGFTLTRPTGAKSGLAWGEITQIRETADFYALSSATLQRKRRAYLIPRHCDLMPAEQYQQGLATFLSRCPTAPAVS